MIYFEKDGIRLIQEMCVKWDFFKAMHIIALFSHGAING